MNFIFFSVSENGENGLGDEGADGAMLPPPVFLDTLNDVGRYV